MWSGGLSSIILLGLISGSISHTATPGPKCDYTLLAPFKLSSGSESTVCSWVKCQVPVTVTITLQFYSLETVIYNITDTSEYYECASFKAPEVTSEQTVYFTFSAVGDNVSVSDRKPAVVGVLISACLANKDRPIYKPGETIQFRFPCFDENLKQDIRNFTKLTLVDPTGTRVNQILDPTLDNGVLVASFSTSRFSRLGFYSIQAEDDKGKTEYTYFQVQSYELPRFSWNVQCPNTISVLEKTIEIGGSAVYEYGKPVPGTVVFRCCRNTPKYGREANCFQGVNDICVEFTKELDENGTCTESLDTDVFKLPFSGLENYVFCEMTMKENGTGVLVPSSCYMSITDRLAVIQLDRTSIYYNKVNVLFDATLTDEKGNPLAFRTIVAQIDGVDVKFVTTDSNGKAHCEIDTSSYHNANITLTAIYRDNDLCYGSDNDYYNYRVTSYPYDQVVLYRYYSKTGSQLRIRPPSGELACSQVHTIQVDYSFTKEGVGDGAAAASIKYIIQARNKIVAHGEIFADLSESYKGSTSISFYADAKFATGADVLIFATLAEDVISDKATLNIGICFENEVNMTFTEPIVEPGATVYRQIKGAPGSFCGLRAKDTAFNLISSYDEFNAYSVYSSVRSYIYGYQHGGVNYEDPEPPCIDGNTEQFCNGFYVKPTSSWTDRETRQDFKDLSVLFFTNLIITRPKVCGMENQPVYPYPVPYTHDVFSFASAGAAPKRTDTVRSDFRTVFGYDLITIGSNGDSLVTSTIPQRITSWESDAFCISADAGIGVTIKPAKTTTFQQFFVDAPFPSQVTRGEAVIVPIVVANYMERCAMITVEVESSENYEVTPLDNAGEQCACNQERVSWKVAVTFTKINAVNVSIRAATAKISSTCDGANDANESPRSDTIILSIDVTAEGIKREASSSHLITVTGSTTEVNVTVAEPANLVPDSFALTISVMGDPVALPVENLDDLLSTPFGCCDQLQASLLSVVFLGDYLEALGDLNEDRSKRILNRLSSGYMDLLSCRQYDGTYGLFINGYGTNSWVTLLSLRATFYLRKLQFVDDSILVQGIIYLSRIQDLKSGCLIPEGGELRYQESYNSSVQFTAAAAPILLELATTYSNAGPLLDGIKSCLDAVNFESQNTLTQSYMSKAAAAFEQWDKWQSYYNVLAGKAITNGDLVYWRNDNSETLVLYQYFPRQNLGDVLITSNVLIGLTKYPNLDQVMKNSMGGIAKWLSGQATRRGGWYSAQDTLAAIEALTNFGKMINQNETDAEVSLLRNGTEIFRVAVNKDNRFVVQIQELSPSFGQCKIVVSGHGSPFVQLTAYFNTKIAEGEISAFLVTAQASAFDCFGGIARSINVHFSVSYVGNRGETGITVFTTSILSGYIADFSSSKLPELPVYRIEDNKALFFANKITSTPLNFTLAIYLRDMVSNYQSASIVVEEIQTGETGAAQYYHPCGN